LRFSSFKTAIAGDRHIADFGPCNAALET